MQSGKPVGIFRTHEYAPRVLICQLQPGGPLVQLGEVQRAGEAGPDDVRPDDGGLVDLHRLAGHHPGHFETFAAAGEKHFGGELAGKLIVSGGMGGMGGAQPLAATMTGACFLGIEVDPERIKKRLRTGYCDFMVEYARRSAAHPRRMPSARSENVSVGLVGNCGDIIPELAGAASCPTFSPTRPPRTIR